MIGQGAPNTNSIHRRLLTFIHVLNNKLLLNIFCLCRPVLYYEGNTDDHCILRGKGRDREFWWYKLIHVCQRWRYLVLESAPRLDLHLLCTRGTPVVDMLAHHTTNSYPLPLVLDYRFRHGDMTVKDEEGIALALRNHDRIRRIRLLMPATSLRKLVDTMDGEFPVLEYLHIRPTTDDDQDLKFPVTFQAPRLHRLALKNISFPIASPFHITTTDLRTLSLDLIPPSAHFHPCDLLTRLSHMPKLETLSIIFHSHSPSGNIEWLLRAPFSVPVTLPTLYSLEFKGASSFLEILLSQLNTPLLEKLRIMFPKPTFSVRYLPQLVRTTENLKFSNAKLTFNMESVSLVLYPREGGGISMNALHMEVACKRLTEQVASAAQIFNDLGKVFSPVDSVCLDYERSQKVHDEDNHTRWLELLKSFQNVRTLHVPNDLVRNLSRALHLRDGASPIELLPGLKELSYSRSGNDGSDGVGRAFTSFIEAREAAGGRVRLVGLLGPPAHVPRSARLMAYCPVNQLHYSNPSLDRCPFCRKVKSPTRTQGLR